MYLNEKKIRDLIRKVLLKEADLTGGLEFEMPYSEKPSKDDELVDGVIEGKRFVVQGVEFVSVPSKAAAAGAMKLYNVIGGAGDKQPDHPKVPNKDSQKKGLDLIKTHIYDAAGGNGEKYIKRTGTPNESYWSSWFLEQYLKTIRYIKAYHGLGQLISMRIQPDMHTD